MTTQATSLVLSAPGMVCPIGLSAPAACAAARAGIKRFQELPFQDREGESIVGAVVPQIAEGLLGRGRVLALAHAAASQCMLLVKATRALQPSSIPILLGLASDAEGLTSDQISREFYQPLYQETGLPGEVQHHLGGGVLFFSLLRTAQSILLRGRYPGVMLVVADSLIRGETLRQLELGGRLKTLENSDGIIPAEAAVAFYVQLEAEYWMAGSAYTGASPIRISGVGLGNEPAPQMPGTMNRAEGLTSAIRMAIDEAQHSLSAVDFHLAGLGGERVEFLEVSLATARLLDTVKSSLPFWTPADSLGSPGVAMPGCLAAVVGASFARRYAPGPRALILGFGADTDQPNRGAAILTQLSAH